MLYRQCTKLPATAEGLRQQFLAEGFHAGPPPNVPAEVLMIDLHVNGRQRCPDCRKRLRVEVWTDGVCHRLLCSCPTCSWATEG
jgi:hypothetical protein